MSPDTESKPSLKARFDALLYDPFLARGERRGMRARRRELLAGARGRVLELGAGTGLNIDHYPAGLDELVLTEPDAGMVQRLRRRVASSGREAAVVAAPAEELPFADASFDTVVSTMVLCTAADAERAVAEARRVLAPGGRLLFIEHVRAEDPKLARWQDRLERPWAVWGNGCRCNQPTHALLDGHFHVHELRPAEWLGMPKIVRPLLVGSAAVR